MRLVIPFTIPDNKTSRLKSIIVLGEPNKLDKLDELNKTITHNLGPKHCKLYTGLLAQ